MRKLILHVLDQSKEESYMVVNRDGLPWDRAAEEGAQERIQWLHPRDDNHRGEETAPLICAKDLSSREAATFKLVKPDDFLVHLSR